MAFHVGFNLGFQIGHGFAACHKIGNFFAGLFALAEIRSNRPTDQHRKVIAHCHRMHHLMGDENHRKATPLGFVYDAQNVGIGRVLQTVLALPDGGLWVPVPTRGLAYLRSDWRRIAAFSAGRPKESKPIGFSTS